MSLEKRQDPRYKVLGRVQCDALSPLNATLVDISLHGCQIYYSVPVVVCLEDEYTLFIQTAERDFSFTLICRPIRVNEDSGKTLVGMSVLRSPDSEKLNEFISHLKENRAGVEFSQSQIVESECQFL